MELSVIIPVYNTKTSILERCIESILKIKNIKYEIVIINDGSNELYGIEYENLIKNLNNDSIRYIFKENGGVSSARNMGIKYSSGKYIMFVDSDDTIDAEKIKTIHFQKNADVILYNKIIIKKNKRYVVKELEQGEGKIDIKYAIEQFVKNDKFHSPCAKLFSKDFIDKYNICFDTNIIHGEDAVFNFNILENSPSLYYTNYDLYEYFYDYCTAEGRWIKYPEKMLNNVKFLHDLKIAAVKKWLISDEDYLVSILYNKYIKNLFTASMCLDRKKNIKTLDNIKIILKSIIIKQYDLKFFIKIKYYLMKNGSWNTIMILKKIRKMYLKYK